MSAEVSSTHSLSVYRQSNGLLFQFILEEYLAVLPEVEAIRQNYSRLEAALVRRKPNQEVEQLVVAILGSIAALTGSAFVSNNTYPWTPTKGSLEKLKHYTHLFHSPSKDVEEMVGDLKVAVSKAYHSSLQARDVLWQISQGPLVLPEASALFRLLGRLIENIQKVTDLLPSIIAQFRHDENVLFMLTRRHREFDALSQEGFVAPLLDKIFLDGLDEVELFLKKRYEERGFNRLLEQIEEDMVVLREKLP